ncbi:MAG: hypothetical protein AAF715_19460 [Myxococcota bacterium]
MTTYTVCFSVAEWYEEVEAESPQEAIENALERIDDVNLTLCNYCYGDMQSCDPNVVSVVSHESSKDHVTVIEPGDRLPPILVQLDGLARFFALLRVVGRE